MSETRDEMLREDPREIWLAPACEGDERTWAADNPWGDQCDECDLKPVRYIRADLATLPREEPGEVERVAREMLAAKLEANGHHGAAYYVRDAQGASIPSRLALEVVMEALSSLSPAPVQAEGMREALSERAMVLTYIRQSRDAFKAVAAQTLRDDAGAPYILDAILRYDALASAIERGDHLSQAPRPSEGGGADV